MHRRILNRVGLTTALQLALLGAIGATQGCSPSLPSAPVTPVDNADFESPNVPSAPGIDEPEEQSADLLAPGDVIAIRVLGDSSLDLNNAPIDRAGYVHLPLLGTQKVAGKTLEAAQMSLQDSLRKVDRFSVINLALVDGKGRVATVLGAVEKSGLVPLINDSRLSDVLAYAGGLRTSTIDDRLVNLGDIDGVRVVRNGTPLPIDPRKAIQGEPRHNVRIRPGDVVHVPPALSSRISVLGYVNKPRTMAFRPGMRLTECLAESGGITRLGDTGDIRIIRGGYARPRVYTTSVKALMNGQGADVLLAAGDVVYVTEHWFATVGEVLDKLIPTTTTGLAVGLAASR